LLQSVCIVTIVLFFPAFIIISFIPYKLPARTIDMNQPLSDNYFSYNNILYIGDDARTCLDIIEKFTGCILQIEENYAWLVNNPMEKQTINHWLQHQIQYHFEGGIAIFRFKNEDELPAIVRNECVSACKSLAFERLIFVF